MEGAEFPSEKLWNFKRLRRDLSVAWVAFLVIWTPVGLVLCLVRILLFIAISLVYPFVHCLGLGELYARLCMPLLGYWVIVRGRENLRQSTAQIVVSNHVSDFDACAMWAVAPPSEWMLVMNDHWRSVVTTVQRIGWPVHAVFTSEGKAKDEIKSALSANASDGSRRGVTKRILFFPEGATCSGIAVMQFNWFIFGLEKPIVPCCIRLTNPWPIQMQMNGIGVVHNVLALFFLPGVCYEITFLPEVSDKGLSKEDFSNKVRSQICRSLSILGAKAALKNKKEYATKRRQLSTTQQEDNYVRLT